MDLSDELGIRSMFPSPTTEIIFNWFSENTKASDHQVGNLFEAAYFFDATFWELNIPHFYGMVPLNLMNLLEMPENIKSRLQGDVRELQEYACCAADALDYGLGIDAILKDPAISDLVKSLAFNANSYLRSCAHTLRAHHPDRSVVQNARFAAEIALKALLCARWNYDEASIKNKFGHDLSKLLEEAILRTGDDFLKALRTYLVVFPTLSDRYTGEQTAPRFLWDCYRLALALNAAFTRIVSGTDNRAQLLGKKV